MPSAQAKEIFLDALAQFGPERAAVLASACAGDASLRAEVEELLRVHDAAGEFLNAPSGAGRTRGLLGGTGRPSVTLTDFPLSEKPGAIIGRYKLLQQIGEGGFGVVYMAEQEKPVRRKVALKIIKLGMDTRQVIARFEAERQALAMMEHPNIAKVLDAGATETGRPYFVMELVKGIPITQFCDREKVSLPDRLRLFLDVCNAVQHAHTKGIIHRDIKPSNILVTLHDSRPVPKVIDFGIAKATEQKLTEQTMFTEYGQFIGTPAYMSPEQAEISGLDVDTRSDIYSLGVLLYELLTSSLPFDPQRLLSAGQAGMARIIKEEEPHRPSTRLRTLGSGPDDLAPGSSPSADTQPVVSAPNSGTIRPRTVSLLAIAQMRHTDPTSLVKALRGDLDWIAMKCLEKDRTRRYESAAALARDVARFLAGETVSAAPPSAGYRVRKFVRRNRGVVTTAALVGTALVLGLVSTTAGFLQARKQRNAAQLAYTAEQEHRRIAVVERDKTREYAEVLRHELYASTIEKIQRIIATDGVEPVQTLLEECPPDLRGWEWERLRFLADRSAATIRAADGAVYVVAFAGDGATFMTGDGVSRTCLWDAESLKLLAEMKDPQATFQRVPALSKDGRIVVTASGAEIYVWNARSGRLLRKFEATRNTTHGLGLDASGTRVAVGFYDGGVEVYDTATGMLLLDSQEKAMTGRAAAFSRDGTRILSTSMGNHVSMSSAVDGELLWTRRAAIYVVINAAFSPDEEYVATIGFDSRLWLRHADNGELVYTVSTGKGASGALAFHPQGEVIAIGGSDGLISLFRTATGEKLYSLHGHESPVLSIDFDPTGRFLISGASDGKVKRWHLGIAQPQATIRHVHVITGLGFAPDNSILWAVGGAPEDLQALAVDALHRIPVLCPLAQLWSMALSHDGERMALSGSTEDGTLQILLTDRHLSVLQRLIPPDRTQSSLGFSPDGKWLAAGAITGPLRVYDTESGTVAWDFGDRDQRTSSNPVLFSRDGRFVINGSREGTVRVFVAQSGELVREFSVSPSPIETLAMSYGGDRLFCGNESNIEVWNWRGAAHHDTMAGHSGHVSALAMMPGDRRLVSGGSDGTIRMWDVNSGRQVMLVGRHDNAVRVIAISPDGATIATGGEDNSFRIWETVPPKEEGLDARYERERKAWAPYRDPD